MTEVPEFIYKIAPASPQPQSRSLAESYDSPVLPPSQLDQDSGFVHMSTANQVAGTLRHFFSTTSGEDTVYLLKLRTDKFANGELKWESPDAKVCGPRPGEGLFPHLYLDGRLWLNFNEVMDTVKICSKEGENGWDNGLLEVREWLV